MKADNDVDMMRVAYEAINSIPIYSNRRRAAMWWLNARVNAEIQQEMDAMAIERQVERQSETTTPAGVQKEPTP